ncbi:aldo/keto reductase [Thermodesulfobacteriota bacterium]
MDYIKLGRTDLKVSVMGLGCGGPSRVGQRSGKTEAESVAIIREALNSGINFIDTSEAYGTEEIVGHAIKDVDRSSVVISTKKKVSEGIQPKDVEKGLEDSLKRLGTDYVDIYNFHAVVLKDYGYLYEEIIPTLEKMREQGKIRFIGISERFNADPGHDMLVRALDDDIWDVMMVGFNILNQSARDRVFQRTMEKDIGIQIMFAVRLALSRTERLKEVVEKLIENKQVNPADIDVDDPLGFLIHESGAESTMDAAYRFCLYEPGTHVILSGTGNPDHLQANLESFARPPLPHQDLLKLRKIFHQVDSITGQ